MNCKICFQPFDHSFRQPYILHCTHTYCRGCVNAEQICPICNIKIDGKILNLALLESIPLSNYDKLKIESLNSIKDINKMHTDLNTKRQNKLDECFNKLNQIKEIITNETNKNIDLLKANQKDLIDEINQLEIDLVTGLTSKLIDQNELTNSVKNLEENELNEEELLILKNTIMTKNKDLNDLSIQIENFKKDYEFVINENINFKQPFIGELKTDDKVKIKLKIQLI